MVIRTGPAGYNRILVDRFRGAMLGDMEMRDGRLWCPGRPLDTPTEVSFFAELVMAW